ncbi:nitroreductase/quinone reductase family protein [Blastococcus litoris]|uniref:nitroreductase/quinone reductase family protein n=1 Tax=Blastococcus litoris TaxID=2171622 RepID=UPI000E30370E|nr:nitroreductase/quinone reductase family protein [Blastococcus litoris]
MAARSWFWTNRVANPVLRRVLRTPLGRGLGRSLAVVRYTGRRTATPHELVCQYVRDGDRVWILVGQAERKTWWRNLRSPSPVDLWLAGRHLPGSAVAVVGAEDPGECGRGLAVYGAAGTSPAEAVMVRVDLPAS